MRANQYDPFVVDTVEWIFCLPSRSVTARRATQPACLDVIRPPSRAPATWLSDTRVAYDCGFAVAVHSTIPLSHAFAVPRASL